MPLPLDLDKLLAPISEEKPAGSKSAFLTLKDQFNEFRREQLPEEDIPAEDVKEAEWHKTEEAACEALEKECKDYRIAGYLTEALIKLYGFHGLDAGLKLLQGLYDKCWDWMHPELDEDDPTDFDLRVEPLENLLDSDRGLRLPFAVRSVPLARGEERIFNYLEWEADQKKGSTADFEKAIDSVPPEQTASQLETLNTALETLAAFRQLMQEKMGSDAPALVHLEDSMKDCQRLLDSIVKKNQPDSPEEGAEGDSTEAGQAGTGAPRAPSPAQDRKGILKQLGQLADNLEKLEPHSPVPYLIRRAVALGEMDFPELLGTIVRDSSTVAELTREFGLPKDED